MIKIDETLNIAAIKPKKSNSEVKVKLCITMCKFHFARFPMFVKAKRNLHERWR